MKIVDSQNLNTVTSTDAPIILDLFCHPDTGMKMGMAVFPVGSRAKPTAHEQHEYCYILEGSLKVIVGNVEYIMRAGQASYIDAGDSHESINDFDTDCRLIWVLLNGMR